MTRYRFRPVEIADLPLLARWLATPHVAAWQGDPATELKEIESCIGDARMHALIPAELRPA
jgi:aminoglycoside 6'-N-acetyltransferase